MSENADSSPRFEFKLRLPWESTHSAQNRSSKAVKDDVVSVLRQCPSLDADNINVQVVDHKVILTGTVSSFDNRRLAADAAFVVPGVDDVINFLKVTN